MDANKKDKKIKELKIKTNSLVVTDMQQENTKLKDKIKALELSARTDRYEIQAYKHKVGIVEIINQEKFDETIGNLRRIFKGACNRVK